MNNKLCSTHETVAESEWRLRKNNHQETVCKWTVPFRDRRRVGRSHPIEDFLFVYYHYSTTKLERWHPGIGFLLSNAATEIESFGTKEYATIGDDLFCDTRLLDDKTRRLMEWTANLLRQTQVRKGNYSCLGLHEWAMVYRGAEVRHEQTTKLRLPQPEIDAFLESRSITCSHFDAFRFFALDAKPMNRVQPTLESRPQLEQPACIHANMDLYKWAFKSMPWVGSDLLLRCFDLAMFARLVDMRASPYDLSEFGCIPIKIETPDGRAEYERLQRLIAEKAAPLREELAIKLESILEATSATSERRL